MAGDIRNIRKGAILTMVDECSRALTGVGATIAPNNHLLKGSCAPFIKAATAINPKGSKVKADALLINPVKVILVIHFTTTANIMASKMVSPPI